MIDLGGFGFKIEVEPVVHPLRFVGFASVDIHVVSVVSQDALFGLFECWICPDDVEAFEVVAFGSHNIDDWHGSSVARVGRT